MAYTKILIAVDSSPCSFQAARKGLELADLIQVPVALVFVIDRSQEIIHTDLEITPIQRGSFLEQQACNTMDKIIEAYGRPSRAGQILQMTPEGLPKDEILASAEKWGADLIILGTHGRTGIAHFLLGSIAEYIVRHAKVPVMVVPEQSAKNT